MRNNVRAHKNNGAFFEDDPLRETERAQHYIRGEVRRDMQEMDIGV